MNAVLFACRAAVADGKREPHVAVSLFFFHLSIARNVLYYGTATKKRYKLDLHWTDAGGIETSKTNPVRSWEQKHTNLRAREILDLLVPSGSYIYY